MMTCQHPGCDYKSAKRASITRHFQGTNALRTHTAEELARTFASAAPDADASAAPDAPASSSKPGPDEVDAAASDAVQGPPKAPIKADGDVVKECVVALVKDDAGFRDAVINGVVAELLKLDAFSTRALAAQTVTPRAVFGQEASALMRSDDVDARMWRGALISASGAGLAEMVAKKHVTIFKNVRPSDGPTAISIYRGAKGWASVGLADAAKTMLARSEHDVLDLYESEDPAYTRCRGQIETFASTVGAKLGWDTSPYGCRHAPEADDAFGDAVTAMIAERVSASFQ